VRVLSRLFRAKFLAYLRAAFRDGKLGFYGELKLLGEKRNFIEWLTRVAGTEWVVYAKPPFGGPQQMLKYLARYTHRVAISNKRLITLDDGRVTFQWKNYAHANEPTTMTLKAEEFNCFPPRLYRVLLKWIPRKQTWISLSSGLSAHCQTPLHSHRLSASDTILFVTTIRPSKV
jgi:Putative transposase